MTPPLRLDFAIRACFAKEPDEGGRALSGRTGLPRRSEATNKFFAYSANSTTGVLHPRNLSIKASAFALRPHAPVRGKSRSPGYGQAMTTCGQGGVHVT